MSNHDPYGQPPEGQNQYGQNPYGQQPPVPPTQPPNQPPTQSYGSPQYGAPQYGSPQYGAPYAGQQYNGQQYGMPYLPPPSHPKATTAMVLGLTGLIGGLVCGLGFLISPFAWAVGSRTVKEIDASKGQLAGRDQANTGRITGIIGTVLLALAVLALALVIAIGVAGFDTYSEIEQTAVQNL